ncbi:MAG: hypothetical protein H7Y06_06460 [Opitutaceae bacterium]|nr:hypothetical protein [Opitutaceae bacterium]
MKTSNSLLVVLGVVCVAGLAGCGKSEPAASAPAAPVAEALAAPKTPESSVMAPALAAVKRASEAVVTSLQVPDFQTATVEDLSDVATQALSGLGQVASSAPTVVEKVNAIKTALASGQASQALSSLAGLSAAAKSIPGAANIAETATQVVSAWALKQGFDVAKISGVLGALQKKDYAALASQATSVLSKGGLTGDQKGLLNGVLGAYGIDATKAAGAVSSLKGLMGN